MDEARRSGCDLAARLAAQRRGTGWQHSGVARRLQVLPNWKILVGEWKWLGARSGHDVRMLPPQCLLGSFLGVFASWGPTFDLVMLVVCFPVYVLLYTLFRQGHFTELLSSSVNDLNNSQPLRLNSWSVQKSHSSSNKCLGLQNKKSWDLNKSASLTHCSNLKGKFEFFGVCTNNYIVLMLWKYVL